MSQDRSAYMHDYYEAHKDIRRDKLKEKRELAQSTYTLLTTHQPCEKCGAETGAETLWRHREKARDTKDSQHNLVNVRYAARMGYSQRTLEQHLSDLMPLCAACFTTFRPDVPEKPTDEQLATHQLYERNRKKKPKAVAQAAKNLRIQAKLDWLDEYLDKPCAFCGNTYRVTWHYREREFDHPDQRRNLSHTRSLCKQGASLLRIQASLTDLLPMCQPCYKNPVLRRRRLDARATADTTAVTDTTDTTTADTGKTPAHAD